MSHQHHSLGAADARTTTRTNMYMAVVLHWAEHSSTAKIRNLSSRGALLESTTLPPLSTAVRLIRGSLSAAGKAVWLSDGRCGIQFSEPVTVSAWIAPPANQEQSRVDRSIELLRAGAVPIGAARHPEPAARPRSAERFGIELAGLACSLEHLADLLGEDPYVVQKFWRELQNFDQIAETLDLAAAFMMDGGRNGPDFAPRLEHLRAIRAESTGQGS